MDPLSIVQDEVALEGLDGITTPTLWIRLENRSPKFQLNLDQCTKEFIWKSLVSSANLTFYELPQERNDVVLFDRFEDIDPDTGIQAAQGFSDTKNDIYPIHVIEEDKHGIQGSCIFYKERKNVTNIVRSKDLTALVSLEEAFNRYGRRLVVVASQEMRFRTLISEESDPELKLTDNSYCILERLGRARWQGELQRDLHTCSFKTDAGKMHYLRRSLDRHGLITMQSHVIRLPSGQQQHSILLLLKRFHIIRRSKYDILMESMSNILLETPDRIAPMITLREQLNVSERTFKRIYQYMQSAKLVQIINHSVEALNPSAGPCNTKKGTKVLVRCVRLIKPYVKKELVVNDDDNEDEDGAGANGNTLPSEGRVMERDLMSQAYQIVVSSGTRGISQSALRLRMRIGKLEVRMLVRMLQRTGVIKGFLEDEGRQRTTKFIGHRCVCMSDRVHQFAKERERNQLLCSSGNGKGAVEGSGGNPKISKTAASKTPATSRSKTQRRTKTPSVKAVQEKDGEGDEDGKEGEQKCSDGQQVEGDGGLDGGRGKTTGERGVRKEAERKLSEQTRVNVPITHSTPIGCKAPPPAQAGTNKMSASQSLDSTVEEGEESVISPDISLDQSDCPSVASNEPNDSITVVEDIPKQKPRRVRRTKRTNLAYLVERPHETYRLLRRKNMIVESVRSLKIIEGLYTLQKMINEEEKQDGVSTKCCKKSILRLISSLSREGMLKMYTTTVVQDGVSKKVEFVVHPSIQPNDPIVKSAIEQVRFRISSSYTVARAQQAEEKAKEQANEGKGKNASSTKAQRSKADKKKADTNGEAFKPTIVRGMSRTLGYQPKMHRLRLIHNFLWYVIYGHPLRQNPERTQTPTQSPTETNASNADDAATHTDLLETPETSNPSRSVTDESNSKDANDPQNTDGQTSTSENPASSAGDQPTLPQMEVTSSAEDEEQLVDAKNLGHFHPDVKVYVEEDSWRRFVPPVPVHREFGSGWALVSDLLLCLPLSLYVQVIQINYLVDGLEAYLNDPVKQHYLIRFLPSKMRRQMLYKRKYIFNFHENMQRLVYMGLLQFGPVEKFQDKDQVFVFLRRKATIVDTTSSEPHYWLVTEPPGKKFERRQYTLDTVEDVENYWFDLLCVCLNTPLGVVRFKKEVEPEVPDRYRFLRMADLLKGSREVCDDGSIPGDGKGAGGLDSDFFGHLKRNWLWTNPLLVGKKYRYSDEMSNSKVRLKSLLSKNSLMMALKAGGSTSPRCVTTKRPLIPVEDVEVAIEPANRNQQVVGGKKQKRKRSKKEIVKIPRKRKKDELRKRTPAHDEADHRALKRMTRQRVYWSIQEDSLMMLCSVASQLLNSKMKRPFVPYCVVRDMLHAEFEKSLDKTSLAVGRRTRYILKNPQTLLNYRICLAEVYQDKPLMALLEKKKPENPDEPEECAAAFSEYTRLLRQKFSSAMTSSDIILPETKQQLFSRFKVYTIDDEKQITLTDTLNSKEDIHAIVLNNLIQSTLAMSNSQMKSCRSFQTFHTYSTYNQEVLCQVFLQCRRRGLVNRRRVGQRDGRKKNRALPILPMSYQLSQTYYRCFSWRFPYALCTDVFQFMRALRANGTGDDRPFTDFHHEPEERTDEREESKEMGAEAGPKNEEEEGKERGGEETQRKEGDGKEDDRRMDEPEGRTEKENNEVTKEGENCNKEDEEKVEVEEKNEEEEGNDKINELIQQENPEQSFTVNSSNEPDTREQTQISLPQEKKPGSGPTSNHEPRASNDLKDVSDMMQFPLDCLGGAGLACLSLMTLGLLSMHVSIPKQMVVVDSSLVDNEAVKSIVALEEDDDDDDDAEECEGRKRMEVKARQASHTNYLMMRGYCSPGIVKLRNLNPNDSIVVESCIMRLKLRSTPAHHMFCDEVSPLLNYMKHGPSLLPSLLTHSICPPSSPSQSSERECEVRLIHQRGYSPQDMEACAELRRSLDAEGQKGLGVHDFFRVHTHLAKPHSGRTRGLQQYIQELQEEGQVLRVGGLGVRYVLTQHARPWLLTSNSRDRSRSPTQYRSRFRERQHKNISFMRKRGLEDPEHDAEPPTKRLAEGGEQVVVEEETGEVDGPSRTIVDGERSEGEKKGKENEGEGKRSGDGLLNSEEQGGKQTLLEEEGKREMEEEGGGVRGEEKTEERGVGLKEGEKEEMGRTECDDGASRSSPPSSEAVSDDGGDVCFISRPWRLVDGSLNRPVCKGMLEAVLYHIMTRPGLTLHTLVEHYRDVLQPMVVLDLTEALVEMGCVRKRTVVKSHKPSLFSRPGSQSGGGTGMRTGETETAFYEPTISCCLRLAHVLPKEPNWNQFLQLT